MKTIMLETFWVIQAVALWTIALPAAAVLFGVALLRKKVAPSVSNEPFGPAGMRLSRASA
jgi:hypothetical protein